MFTGRKAELEKLKAMYQSDGFECAVIYGRRRVGKTTLIKEFIKDKKAVYFLAREADGAANLRVFSNDVYTITAPESAKNSLFTDWENAFDYIGKVSQKHRFILAIDEFPYLAGGFRSISSIIQAHIDNTLKDGKLFLILCGSSMSFMENQVLGYKSPLYGRRTAQFKIEPFSFFEALPFFTGFTNQDKAILYGAVGGIPEYLGKINPKKNVKQNIGELFLSPQGRLYEEPSNLIKQELREPATYNGIIEAVASGATRLNDIASRCGIETNKCAKYIKSLISLGIMKKEAPVTETSRAARKSIYVIDDFMFRFWYRFVYPNMSAIAAGLPTEKIYQHEIEPYLSEYMGFIFEEICKQFLVEEAKRDGLPFFMGKSGRWWGNNPKEKRQEEIDILCYHGKYALFCECKWTNAQVDMGVFKSLAEKSGLFHFENVWYWLFSKSGFTKELVSIARAQSNIRLVRLDDMLESDAK